MFIGITAWFTELPPANLPFQTTVVGNFGTTNCSSAMLLIAIDFDETLTRDAALWSHFISFARLSGHRVICVTARRPTDDNHETIDEWMRSHGIELPVFYSALGSKVEYMEKQGQKVDIWIDDDPKRCALGH